VPDGRERGPDYLGSPAVLGTLKLSLPMVNGASPTIEDLAVYGSMVVVGASGGKAEVVSLADPTKPKSAGVRADVGGRLAVNSSGILFSTANSLLGIQGPVTDQKGVTSTQLGPPRLLTLKTPRVVVPMVLDDKQQNAVGGESGPQFVLSKPARITFKNKPEGSFILARLDGQDVAREWKGREEVDVVPAGPHRLWVVDSGLEMRLGDEQLFELNAIDVELTQRSETETGKMERDRRDRDVLPVGTTFVNGVSISNGQQLLSRTDFELPGRNFQLKMTRTYSSSARRWDGLLGANWDWPYEGRIEKIGRENDRTFYVVRTISGTTQEFEETSDCVFVKPKGYHTDLKCVAATEHEEAKLVFTDFQKTEHTFKRLPRVLKASMDTWWIQEMKELHGDKLKMRYDDFGRIVRVSELHDDVEVHALRFEYTQAGGDDRVSAAY
jgi:hypothetical protein